MKCVASTSENCPQDVAAELHHVKLFRRERLLQRGERQADEQRGPDMQGHLIDERADLDVNRRAFAEQHVCRHWTRRRT